MYSSLQILSHITDLTATQRSMRHEDDDLGSRNQGELRMIIEVIDIDGSLTFVP